MPLIIHLVTQLSACRQKPENILLNESRTACKVADFGLAREAQGVGMTYYVSTRWYRAPEVILRCPYGKPVDVFATGLCLAELCCLRPLFPGATEIDQISKMVELFGPPTEWEEGAARMRQLNFRLVNPAESEHIEWAESVIKSDAPRHLIEQMLSWNPASRPSAETALQCEYFQSKESDMALSRTGTDQSKSNIGIRAKQVQETTDAEPTWHGILRDEFVIEQSSVPHPGIGKSDANSFLSLSGTNQPEDNEFSQYLDAISSTTHGEVGHNLQSGSRSKPSGNHCRRFNVESKPNSGIAPRLFQHGGSDQSTSGAAGVLDGLPAERGAKRPIPYRRFGHDKRTAERPQWLLSNQSIGKRAMEVRITRPKHVDEMNPDNLDRYELPSTPFRSGE
jgi:serine/threonine protein kinase